jgi:hypothetical protein
VKACPTKALRVRGGGPKVLDHLCIDCTSCIAACSSGLFGAGREPAESGTLAIAEGAVLVVPEGFVYGFPGNMDGARVVEALYGLGFSEVRFTEEWEAVLGREAAARAGVPGARLPLIPPVCPAVVNLVESYFPSLIPQLVPLSSPVEAATVEFSTQPVYLTAACPAQYAEAAQSSLTDRLTVLSPRRLAAAIAPLLSGRSGSASAASTVSALGSAAEGRAFSAALAPARRVTGIRHVIAVLEQLEGGALQGPGVLELFACDQGCAGSPLFAADPFVASLRGEAGARASAGEAAVSARKRPYAPRPGLRLDPDMAAAIAKLSRIDALHRSLPGRDCGTCGAPSCAAFAEDVVLGRADEAECPFKEKRP